MNLNPNNISSSLLDVMIDGREFESLIKYQYINVDIINEIRRSISEIEKARHKTAICYIANVISSNINQSIDGTDDLPFNEMVNLIHFGIATNTPIILEGGTGLGKQTAINYIAHKLNYRIINFIITQSTKVEDLLGRNQIKRNNGQIKIIKLFYII